MLNDQCPSGIELVRELLKTGIPYAERGMESSEIEAFLALAEELHFGRTAERLRLSQSRVSRLIASLERRTGGALFERTSRQVTLTPLGKQLRDRLAPAWSEAEAALADARATARDIDGTLRLGWPMTASSAKLSLLAETFSARFPACEVSIHDIPVSDLFGSLRRGEIDVMAMWLVGIGPEFVSGPFIEDRDRVLMVGRRHRLAGRESVSVEDLAGEEVHLVRGTEWNEEFADAIAPPRTPSGRTIPRVLVRGGWEDTLAQVASGRFVRPTVAGVPGSHRDDLAFVPIRDLPPLPLGLVWLPGCENARIRALADVARELGRR